MDPSVAPIILLALTTGIVATAMELRASLVAPACPECAHCRAAAVDREREAAERRRRQQEQYQSPYLSRRDRDTNDRPPD
ncbi:MAG TPA: hypothetical protein VH720_01820 [Candidatus Limnocylindrales bacterium]|jgi:hypothetical protein